MLIIREKSENIERSKYITYALKEGLSPANGRTWKSSTPYERYETLKEGPYETRN